MVRWMRRDGKAHVYQYKRRRMAWQTFVALTISCIEQNLQPLICARNTHDSPSKPLTNNRKAISSPLERILKQVMPLRTLNLRPSDRFNSRILPTADRAFYIRIFDIFIGAQTTLMEAMLAQEMYDRKLKRLHAHLTPRCLEDDRFRVQVLELCFLGLGVGTKSFDCAAIGSYFGTLALDGGAEVGFDHTHCCDAIG
jgi:hypothetical protein